jgi:pimeloyl-ACP methyl ester carboxylesterase
MSTATVNGLTIGYDVIGDGARTWVLTPGGRYARDTPGLRPLGEALAADGGARVLIWDRPNCGESDVCFEADSESNLHADTMVALLDHLGLAPAIVAGGSAGARVGLLAAERRPDAVRAQAMWWISGGPTELFILGNHYCVPSIRAAWREGMDAVAALPDWAEQIERNPANRQRIVDQDRAAFIATMERWLIAYAPRDGETIPGLPDDRMAQIGHPALVFNSGESDLNHPRAITEHVARVMPAARLVEPPWGDREWYERQAERERGIFVRWPLLAPQLLAWADEIAPE